MAENIPSKSLQRSRFYCFPIKLGCFGAPSSQPAASSRRLGGLKSSRRRQAALLTRGKPRLSKGQGAQLWVFIRNKKAHQGCFM